ncbi:MMPL family transporter [Streptomyces sp. M19]
MHASGGISGRLMKPVLAQPKWFAVAAGVVMLVLCAPALGMKTEQLGMEQQFGSDAKLTVAYKEITQTFPGGPDPAVVVLTADDMDAPASGPPSRTSGQGRRHRPVRQPLDVQIFAEKHVARISVPLTGNGSDSTSNKALDTLRDRLVPDVLGPVTDKSYVSGRLAESRDFNDQLGDDIAPVFLFIAVVTFLLMLVSFRSVPIAVASIVLNLLSVGAAYGVMVAVFQHGWGASMLGTEKVGAIEAWMPLFVLVILFGLSMDYHVFVVSRIREAHERG